jgi:ATP-dependent Clp protease adaptor protein ClpS
MSVMCILAKPLSRAESTATIDDRRQRLFLIERAVNTVTDCEKTRVRAETDAGRVNQPAEVQETAPDRSDRWAVVLFDDSHHSMDFVIWALLKTLPGLSTTDATLIMLEAHNTGKGVVVLCGREQALGYRDALRVLQLGCDVEPGW